MNRKKLIIMLIVLTAAILACAGPGPETTPVITLDRGTPVTQIEAEEAIQTFARNVLGLDIPNLRGGGRTGEINLPISTLEGVEVAIDLAGITYFGIWNQGAASLSFGDSSVSGDWVADVEDGTLGAFVLRTPQATPMDAPTALGMIITAFPGLGGYEFFETNVEEAGYTFKTNQLDKIGIQGWGVNLTGTIISAGVNPGTQEGNSIVWVVVASGALARPFYQK